MQIFLYLFEKKEDNPYICGKNKVKVRGYANMMEVWHIWRKK